MTKQLKNVLMALLLITYGGLGYSQSILDINDQKVGPNEPINTALGVRSAKSDPMVIGTTLYNQIDSYSGYFARAGSYTESKFANYICFAADDFEVPATKTWEVKYVRALVYYPNKIDSLRSINVTFYSDAPGKPGTALNTLTNLTTFRLVPDNAIAGLYELTVNLNQTITLSEGKKWVDIQPVTDAKETASSGAPYFYGGFMLRPQEPAIYSQAHVKNPGAGYYNLTDWTSMSQFWIAVQSVDYKLYNLNFAVFGPEKANDLAVTELINPKNGTLTTNEAVTVVIQNNGTNNIAANDYQIQFRINGGTWSDLEDGLAVASGKELYYTMHEVADLSLKGLHDLEVRIVFAADEIVENNTKVFTVENFGTLYPSVANEKVEYTTCEGTFTDNGGLEATTPSTRDTVVFRPGSANNHIRLEFYDNVMSGAYPIQFFNGTSVNAPRLGEWEELNGSKGIYTQEANNLIIDAANPEGAITIVVPPYSTGDGSTDINNFQARVMCVPTGANDFSAYDIAISKPYSWANESITLTANLLNRGTTAATTQVTFYANGTSIGVATSSNMAMGQKGTASIIWTPPTAGVYELKVEVAPDNGTIATDKVFIKNHTIYAVGALVEGFELEQYPPEGWVSKVPGGTNRLFVWYNSRPDYEGKWDVSIGNDTLITPKLNIAVTDTLEFIYSAGFFGGTCNILYAPTVNGPWKVAHTVAYSLPFTTNYKATLKRAVGVNYIAFDAQGGQIDFIRGANLYMASYDLQAVKLDGPIDPVINNSVNYKFQIRNLGNTNIVGADYTVKLWKKIDGVATELTSQQGVDVTVGNYVDFTFAHTFNAIEYGTVYATIEDVKDVETGNNISNAVDLSVLKENIEYIYWGDKTSDDFDNYSFSGYGANYTEIIYHKDSLGVKGEINGISIYYEAYSNGELPLEIYMSETSNNNTTTGFLSTSVMDLVYENTLYVYGTGGQFKQLYIPFEKPYLYTGDNNLIIALYRPADEDCYMTSIELQATTINSMNMACHAMQCYEKNTDVSNPIEVNELTVQYRNLIPNMQFYFKTVEMDASLSGTIKNGADNLLEGVKVSLEGFSNTIKTSATGTYSFPVMPYGNVNVTASFYGYSDQTKTGNFVAATNTVIDFTMVELPKVEVTGIVQGNDLNTPVAGVEVFMTGYDLEFYDVTDAAGKFTLTEVYGDKNYDIRFVHPKFAEFTTTAVVPFVNTDLGVITLDELEIPPFNIIAAINTQGSVDLTWQAPYTGVEALLDPTLGTPTETYWYNEVDEDVQLGNLFHVTKPGTVQNIEINVFAWEGAELGTLYLRFYDKDRREIMKPVPFTMPNTWSENWVSIEVPDFTYTEEFYVMIHWNKVHQQTAALRAHKHEDNVAWLVDKNLDWMLLTDVVGDDHSGAFSIRANVLEEGTKAPKVLLTYNLWRTPLETVANENTWVRVNADPISASGNEIGYTDVDINAMNDGYYIYTVKANYTKASSAYAYSNTIVKGLYAGVNINVTANNNANIDGAYVYLNNTNGAEINEYDARVSNGQVSFERVLFGTYNLVINNGLAYEVLEETQIEIVSDTTLEAELLEIIYEPKELTVVTDEANKTAELTWAVGSKVEYKNDKGVITQALAPEVGYNVGLGNYFADIKDRGSLYEFGIYGVTSAKNQDGLVRVVVYDDNQQIIGKTDEFVLLPELITVKTPPIEYNGPIYVLVEWSSDETRYTHYLGADISANIKGGAFYRGDDGWSELTYNSAPVSFGVRAYALVGGKRTEISHNGTIPAAQKVEMTSLSAINIGNTVTVNLNQAAAGSRSAESFTIYLDGAVVAEGVTSTSFEFNEADHLTKAGDNTYKAGVKATYVSGESVISEVVFSYNKLVGVLENIDAKLQLYPNPARNTITITHAENTTIEIYNTLGKLVLSKINTDNQAVINVSELASGSYVVNIKHAEGTIHRNLIINN